MNETTAGTGAWRGVRVLVLSPTPTHPQDYGNRKRIHRVCSRFADDGAPLTFVHYPAELEWRSAIPRAAERAMIESWAQYYTVAPTRTLHPHPQGTHHGIDDWWDKAIGEFLRWLFSVQSFDVFIVNYSWLSKAFEFAPPSVFKILDTHDMVSGRREMLELLGLHPEFFFTTEDEEKIALGRADLVWAIKREECALFERMSATPVLTMPHVDPLHVIDRPPPDPDGYLRVGIMGARNNINWVNISKFLEEAGPVFRNAFAPVKIVIGGSVCDTLRAVDSPFVDLRGRVDSVEEFYRTVDCAAVPIGVSTGLKIKTGEALSLGMPVVALAHAFEGFDPSDDLHRLPDFAAMATALAELSFEPRDRLDQLANASLRAHAAATATIEETLDRTRALYRDRRPPIVITADSRAFLPGSIFNLVLQSVHEFLRDFADVIVVVVRGMAAHIVAAPAEVELLGRVIVSEDLPDTQSVRSDLVGAGAEILDVANSLRLAQPRIVIADALHPALFTACCRDATFVPRTEMIALSEGHADFSLPGATYRHVLTAAPIMSAKVAALSAAAKAGTVLMPSFGSSTPIETHRMAHHGAGKTVAILGTMDAPAVALAAAYANAWQVKALIVQSMGDAPSDRADNSFIASFRADEFIDAVLAGRIQRPRFAIDLSAGKLGLPLCREFLERLGVPVIATAPVISHETFGFAPQPFVVRTESELWEVFRSLDADFGAVAGNALREARRALKDDRGLAWLERYCARLSAVDALAN